MEHLPPQTIAVKDVVLIVWPVKLPQLTASAVETSQVDYLYIFTMLLALQTVQTAIINYYQPLLVRSAIHHAVNAKDLKKQIA